MNTLQEEGKKLIEQWREIEDAQRGYEGEKWHCINVKRYHDGHDRNELLKIARKVTKKKTIGNRLADYIQSDIDGSGGIYDNWLRAQWEQLNYELSDVKNLTEGAKDEHEDLKHMRTVYNWAKGCRVLSLGRSGGWACFQMLTDNIADELAEMIEDEEAGNDRREEIAEHVDTLRETIEEVEYIKAHIEKFNSGLDFSDEIQYQMEQKADEYEEEEKSQRAYAKKRKNALEVLSDLITEKCEQLNEPEDEPEHERLEKMEQFIIDNLK